MGAFNVQPQQNLIGLLQILLQHMQTNGWGAFVSRPDQPQQFPNPFGNLPDVISTIPPAPEVFPAPNGVRPAMASNQMQMQAPSSFVNQPLPEQKAINAMKPPPNPWLRKTRQ